MNVVFSLILLLTTIAIEGCPTCMGRITQSSPPFFSDEFYKPTTDNMDELYQAVLELRKETMLTTSTPSNKQESQ